VVASTTTSLMFKMCMSLLVYVDCMLWHCEVSNKDIVSGEVFKYCLSYWFMLHVTVVQFSIFIFATLLDAQLLDNTMFDVDSLELFKTSSIKSNMVLILCCGLYCDLCCCYCGPLPKIGLQMQQISKQN